MARKYKRKRVKNHKTKAELELEIADIKTRLTILEKKVEENSKKTLDFVSKPSTLPQVAPGWAKEPYYLCSTQTK